MTRTQRTNGVSPMSRLRFILAGFLSTIVVVFLAGCPSSTPPGGGGAGGGGAGAGGGGEQDPGALATFSLAWSEYPSWSVFGVAHEKGLIDGEAGKQGPVESKWGVDIELTQLDYDPCIQAYGSATCDAVCITNMDVLSPSMGRESVAILPTSTSVGADACIVVGVEDVDALKEHKVYGLAKTVSEYCFVRNLELLGKEEGDYQFVNMDPAAAATAMQTSQDGYNAIMVWNPFVLQTLRTRSDSKVLFDSSTIPGEIIDMVVVARASLDKPGGRAFAHAVIDTYYQMNELLADPEKGDETLVAIGAKFSSLGLEDMQEVVKQTQFYKTPDEALALFTGDELPKTMDTVVDFCVAHDIVGETPKVKIGAEASDSTPNLQFDPSFIEEVKAKQQ
jgi:NitT/TauT family transport system substrate-binding protein